MSIPRGPGNPANTPKTVETPEYVSENPEADWDRFKTATREIASVPKGFVGTTVAKTATKRRNDKPQAARVEDRKLPKPRLNNTGLWIGARCYQQRLPASESENLCSETNPEASRRLTRTTRSDP